MKGLVAFVAAWGAVSGARADIVCASYFFPSSTYPNPDPGYKKIGDYIYYAEQGGFNQPVWNGKVANLDPKDPGLFQMTEIRMAQPDTASGGTIGFYKQGDAGLPGTFLGQISQSKQFLHENGVTITSWDVSSLNIVLDSTESYFLALSKPMSWYRGTSDVTHWTAGGGWTSAPIKDPGPAYEVWAKPVPAPSTAGLVVAAGLVTLTRRRRAFG